MDGHFQVGSWLVKPSQNCVCRNGNTVQLEPKVMSVLVCLTADAPETVLKEKLLQDVWPDTFVGEAVLVRSISELRRVFEDDAKEPRVIQTIAKRGYRLVAPVVPVNETAHQVPGDGAVATAGLAIGRPPSGQTIRLGVLIGFGLAALLVAILGFTSNKWLQQFQGASHAPKIRSLAVLPLQNLSGDPGQEYFTDGMTEELITELARVSTLKVISRTSVMLYKKTDKSLPQIARELGVNGIIAGSALRSGDRVRITAQLIYAPEDRNVWAETYDRDVRDVLKLQADVANGIVNEIKVRLTPQEEARLAKPEVVNPKALDAYLSGRYHLQHMDDKSDKFAGAKAIQYFQEAIKNDPSYAPAYAGIADALVNASVIASSSDLDQAKSALAKALELDESLIDAHVSLASIRMVYDWDWTGAQKEYQRVLDLNPNSAVGHDNYGYFLDAMGRLDEAMVEHQKAQALDPANDHLGGELYFRRQWNLERDLTAKLSGPNAAGNEDLYRAVEYERLGMEKQAIAEWARVARKFEQEDLAKVLEHGYATSGYEGALKDLVQVMERIAHKEYFPHWVIAHFSGELKDRDRAFAWLDKSYKLHDDHLVFLKVDPFWNDSLRSDPRFADLVRRMGLPQ